MDNDLFTYEVEVAKIPCDLNMDDNWERRVSHEADDDMGYDPSDVAFIEWLRGDDEVELADEESFDSDSEDDVAEVFRIDTNIFDYETPLCLAFNEFNHLLKEPTLVKHHCKPFNYKTGCSEWPTCSWREDGYFNGGNLPGTYVNGNQLHYQEPEWYEALEDSELKEEDLRNKAIEEVLIEEKDDDESLKEREELCEVHKLPVCNIRRFKMIKYSFGQDEEYVAIKEDEYDDLDLEKEISTNIGGEFKFLEILKCWSLETSRQLFNTILLIN
ncbi:hypothetical protein Tco_0961145, partial [Tanacetum coccineum]